MIYNFIDTSAILNGALTTIKNSIISPISLIELESIKERKDKAEDIKADARQAIRSIISNTDIQTVTFGRKELQKIFKKYDFLMDINDHYILCAVELLGRKKNHQIFFYTSDGAQYSFAELLPHVRPLMYNKYNVYDEYKGWCECYPTDKELASLYAHPENNILDLKCNEFAKIIVDDKIVDVGVWTGKKYINLKYNNFTGPLGDRIAPRNTEQKMLFHLLQENNTKIKLALGSFGTGKTMLMLQHALKGIREGRFNKIIFVRNNIITKGSREIGFLSGNLQEKIKPFLMPIADLTSVEYLDQALEEGIIEPVPLGFMRGRDFANAIIFVDEAENLTVQNLQLLIGRVSENSQIWIAGDLKQIDHQDFEKNNGMKKMIERLAGNELFGMVKLIKSERSKTSQMADLLD